MRNPVSQLEVRNAIVVEVKPVWQRVALMTTWAGVYMIFASALCASAKIPAPAAPAATAYIFSRR